MVLKRHLSNDRASATSLRAQASRWLGAAAVALGLSATSCASYVDPAGPVSIDHIEITQGIQTFLNQVPLIAGKTTFVRVLVRANPGLGATPTIGARLVVDGSAAALEPTGVRSLVPAAAGSDRRVLTDSFLFRLPEDITRAGFRSAHVELVPDGASAAATPLTNAGFDLNFRPSGASVALNVYGVRTRYHGVPTAAQARFGLTSSVWPERPFSVFEPQRAGAEGMLPLASLTISRLPGDPIGDLDCRYDGNACAGYVDERPWAQGLIDREHPEGGTIIVILQPEIATGHSGYSFRSPRGNCVINLQADEVDVGATLAHEIGHCLGLPHTFEDPNYPRLNGALGPTSAGALGDFVALRATPDPVLIPGQDAAGNVTAYDTMDYGLNSWFSPYNYCRALAVTSNGRLLCPPHLDGWN